MYRKLYEKVVAGDADAPRYSMNANKFTDDVDGLGKVSWSPTVRWVHMPILVLVIGLITYSFAVPKPAAAPTGAAKAAVADQGK